MTDIVERLRTRPDDLNPALKREAADEIEHLRSALREADAEIEKFSDISFAQNQKDYATLKGFVKQISNALLKVRPLGGSEMFVKRCGDYYADPEYCGRLIDELRTSLIEETKARWRLEKAAALPPSERGMDK